MNFYYLSVLCFIGFFQASECVNWAGNNWALRCDFPGRDLQVVQASGERCGSICASNQNGCTHWSFTNSNGGSCWLKQGAVTKADAIDSSDPSSSCGIHIESGNPHTVRPTNGPGLTNGPTNPTGSALADFTKCQFTYGRDWVGDIDYSAYDYITIWLNTPANGCTNRPECTDFNEYHQGSMLKKAKQLNKIPVLYAYVIAFEARNAWGLKDCDMGTPNLCERGCNYIREHRNRILERYNHHAQNVARIMGRDAIVVFLMEPDFWQFYGDHSQQGGNLSGQEMRALFDDMVREIKKNLPNAKISWDISAWIGEQGHRDWWGHFASSKDIDFLNTSGGRMHGELDQLKPGELRWRFLSESTGKRIIADAGYGIGGLGFNNRGPWYEAGNVNNRANDGVVAVSLAGSERNPTFRRPVC